MQHRLDTDTFYAQALATARASLSYVAGSERASVLRQVARETLAEAHSALSQRDFFAAVDAMGGHDALVDRLAQDLE